MLKITQIAIIYTMKPFQIFKTSILCIILCSAFVFASGSQASRAPSPWKFDAGISAGQLSPVMLLAGVNYNDIFLRVQGLGVHAGANDFWCGIRGSVGWKFLGHLPFNFDMGIGGGYEYAEAPNKMHQALNKANDGNYLLPYNLKESLDVSGELWVHMYGFFTQIAYPIYMVMEHDAPSLIWRIGYSITI